MASETNENNLMLDNSTNGENNILNRTSRDTVNSSSDDENYPKKCKHIKGSVNVKGFQKKLQRRELSEFTCKTCSKNSENSLASADSESTDITEVTSREGSSSSDDAVQNQKQIVICVACAETYCGRYYKKHGLQHYEETKHSISINLETYAAWCYECDEEVIPSTAKNQVIAEVQSHVRKFFEKEEKQKEKEKIQDEEVDRRDSFYEYEKSKKRWQYEVAAPGLANLGNTCFFNSVMQVVVGTSVLHDILTPSHSYYDPPHIDVTKCIAATQGDVGPLTNAFKDFLREMWRTRDDSVAPRELFNQISKKWQQFRGWRQQDSQELMRFLFDGVKSEELELIRKLQPLKPQDEEMINDSEDENHEDYMKRKSVGKYVSFIDACFGGRLVSVIVCDVCKNCSYSYEEFLDVSLPIKSSADDHYKSKNSYGYDYNSGFGYYGPSTFGGLSNTYDAYNNSSQKSDEGSEEHGDNTEAIEEEVSSDTEIEEGIPVPTKEERKRIKLLLRDLPSDSGRSTPNSKEHVTLRECLKSFVKVETLEKDNSFACDNCWKLKEKHDERIMERMERMERTKITKIEDESGDIDDTDGNGQSEGSPSDEQEGNGIVSQESSNNMEGVEPIAAIDNRPNNLSEDEANMDNENSSDTSEDKSNGNLSSGNDYLHSSNTNSLTIKRQKQDSQPERKYMLRKAYKRYLFDSLPPVLVFHLKRFQQVGGRWSVSMRKIDDFVAFDEELDVGDFVVPPEIEKKDEENGINNGHIIDNETQSLPKQNKQNTKYRLYGVVVHLGSLYNGHYIAYVLSRNIREGNQFGLHFTSDTVNKAREIEQKCKTGNQRQWIYCSDSTVKAATVDDVLNSGAYLLFYERVHE
ncbi:hypothetical protein C1645_881985 [Glomus cerebriforme]|uniref:Ubiquitin carboxyl-terminal hydrolase n=1 Tax=Glomus cerebriforme TaxID=658196 RepID=A0A397S2V4_9GLOM|nr:hypothetical protein C1645_881985 [Glomus cerebriforme]